MAKRHTKLLAFMLVLSILASIPAFAANTPRATPGGSDISQEIASKYFEDVFGDGAEEVDYLYEHHIVTGAWQPKGDTLGYFGTDYTLPSSGIKSVCAVSFLPSLVVRSMWMARLGITRRFRARFTSRDSTP